MKQNRASVDGFIPRRGGAQLGDRHDTEKERPIDRSLHTTASSSRQAVGAPRPRKAIGRADIDDSLRDIDAELPQEEEKKKLSRRQRRIQQGKKPKSKARRIIFWVGIGLLTALLAVGGYLAYTFFATGDRVFEGNIFDIVQNEPLKKDENGRSNFVIFGTAEDDENGEHGGANLTDSIMVISVDQEKKDAYMISLPRDLWVDYEETCTVGNQGKINAVYFCASNDGQDEAAGAAALQRKAGEIVGLDIQYYVHLNFTAVVEAVDAVGGVDVKVESNPPGMGILDRNFDWKCNYQCYYVRYDDGEVAHMDGEHALAFARARNAQGGYGLAQGNFDREKNQQKVITALREKALSVGTLTNLGSVTGLLNALGNNLRTNIETKEVRTIMSLASDIPTSSINGLSLVGGEDGDLVTTGSYNGQSIVRPVAGLMVYTEIHDYVQRNVNANPVTREEPHVTVLNGGRAAGIAQTEADRLADEGFIIDVVDNAADGTYERVEIYQLTAEKTASAQKLAELYGVTVKTTTPPVSVVGETDFLIILGPNA
jgi:polyisoprenyl-teichoic acid--peptidoglycan teichoic acid transferase